MKFTSSQPSRAGYNPKIIYFTSASKNLTQFVKVLIIKLSDMLYSSNFVRLFHRQSFTLYGSYVAFIDNRSHYVLSMVYVCYLLSLSMVVLRTRNINQHEYEIWLFIFCLSAKGLPDLKYGFIIMSDSQNCRQ